jgi:hypothetical protein
MVIIWVHTILNYTPLTEPFFFGGEGGTNEPPSAAAVTWSSNRHFEFLSADLILLCVGATFLA